MFLHVSHPQECDVEMKLLQEIESERHRLNLGPPAPPPSGRGTLKPIDSVHWFSGCIIWVRLPSAPSAISIALSSYHAMQTATCARHMLVVAKMAGRVVPALELADLRAEAAAAHDGHPLATERPFGTRARRPYDLARPGRRCRSATTNEQHHSNGVGKS